MDFVDFVVLAPIAGLIVGILYWVFYVQPRRAHIKASGYLFAIKDGNLHIEPIGDGARTFSAPIEEVIYDTKSDHRIVRRHRGPSSHTTTTGMVGPYGVITTSSHTVHTEGVSWDAKGDEYNKVWFFQNNQARTNIRLLLESDETLGLGDGSQKSLSDQDYMAPMRMEMSPIEKSMLYRWLRHHGMPGTPAPALIQRQQQVFDETVKALLDQFRQRFGYKSGDLDRLQLDKNLTPLSYTKLTSDHMLLMHHVARNLTNEKSVSYSVFACDEYHRTHRVYKCFIADPSGKTGTYVVVSQAMFTVIEPILKQHNNRLTVHKPV